MGLIKSLWRSESASERIGTIIQWVGWKIFHHFVYRPLKHFYAIAHRAYRMLRYVYLILAWGYSKYDARAKVEKEKHEAEAKAQEAEEKENRMDEQMDQKLKHTMQDEDSKNESEKTEKRAKTKTPFSPLKKQKTENFAKVHEGDAGGAKRRNGFDVRDENEPTYAPL